MKNLVLLLSLLSSMVFMSNQLSAQKADGLTTESFNVSGNCEMCKAKIEKAAQSAGAKQAVWNPDTKIIVVSYNRDKTNIDAIHQSIAKVGYDTDKVKATDKKYNALPMCCHYDRTATIDTKTPKKD